MKIKEEVPENRTTEKLEEKASLKSIIYGVRQLTEICKLLKSKDIQLYVVLPPTYHLDAASYNVNAFSGQIIPVLNSFDAILIDHTNLDICRKKEFFFDAHHLNKQGAAIYTGILAALMFPDPIRMK